jgi:hypothetical protein
MIFPTKYMNLNVCVLNTAAHIISILKASHVVTYDELLGRLQGTLSGLVRFDFVLALDFLFATGVINYSPETDSVVLIHRDVLQAIA